MNLTLHDTAEYKDCEKYSCLSAKCVNTTAGGENINKGKNNYTKTQRETKKRKRRNKSSKTLISYRKNAPEKYIRNLSNKDLTDAQIKLVSRGLKFIPVNTVNKTKIRRQLLHDFQYFARRMRL